MFPKLKPVCFVALLTLTGIIFIFHNTIPAAGSEKKSPFCMAPHRFTDAEIEAVMPQKATLQKLENGVAPTNAELADNAMSLFNAQFGESLAVSGATAALGNNLFQIPGFNFVDTYLTNVGGALAVLQFMVDWANEKPEAQVVFAKNTSFWAVGTFKIFSRAVKITAVGVFIIDYALNTFGAATISIRYDFWYNGYEEFYNQKYGKNMEKWSGLIFGTYQGDMDRFLKEGMLEFWDKAYINKKYTKVTQPKAFPLKQEQQKMKIQYLRENKILENLKKYIDQKRAAEKKKLRETIQSNYDKMVYKMSETTLFGGRVSDLAGNPLEGAEVRLFNGDPVKTDSAGEYEIAIKACDLYWQLVQWRKQNPGKKPLPQISASWDGHEQTKTTAVTYTSSVANEADFTFDSRELSAVRISDKPITLERYDYVELKATAEYANGTEADISNQVTWSTDDTSVVSIQKKKIKGIHKGETAVYATFSFKNKTLKSNPRKITVRQKKILEKIILQPDALTIKVTETATLKALAFYSDGTEEDISKNPAFKWETDDGSIATVTGGVVQAGSLPGTCTLFIFGMGEGTTIDSNDCRVTVKEALTKVIVPDVTGKAKDEAEMLLKSLKLVPTVSTASALNPTYKPGTIISQVPAPGTPIDENDTVAVTLNPDAVTTRPAMGIRVLPEEKRSYPEGIQLSFVEDIEKKTITATYTMIWYLGYYRSWFIRRI